MNESTPVEATPPTTVEKKNPDRTIINDRRIIADMRRLNSEFPDSQYYHVRVPSLDSLARLLAAMAVSIPGLIIEMTKRDIASAFLPIIATTSISISLDVYRTDGDHFGRPRDLVLFYLVAPFGWNGAPTNFAIFGDAISSIRARFGVNNPSWYTTLPRQYRLYVDDGMLFDIQNLISQTDNTDTWGWFTR